MSAGRKLFLAGCGFELSLLGLAYWLARYFGLIWLDEIRWSALAFVSGILTSVPMLIGFWYASESRRLAWRRISEIIEAIFYPAKDWNWMQVAVLACIAGLGEEALFRGLQGGLAHWVGPWAALAAVSLLFGGLHAITFAYLVSACVISAYLGWIWWTTNNLLVPVVAHAVYDWIALSLVLRHAAADSCKRGSQGAEEAASINFCAKNEKSTQKPLTAPKCFHTFPRLAGRE
jgi:membrane protease YdiL (CAAX protease family)